MLSSIIKHNRRSSTARNVRSCSPARDTTSLNYLQGRVGQGCQYMGNLGKARGRARCSISLGNLPGILKRSRRRMIRPSKCLFIRRSISRIYWLKLHSISSSCRISSKSKSIWAITLFWTIELLCSWSWGRWGSPSSMRLRSCWRSGTIYRIISRLLRLFR